jgi:hypothetical protein
MGGAFLPTGSTRSRYIALLSKQYASKVGGLYNSWSEVLKTLGRFIWSRKAFATQVEEFWKESAITTPRDP